MDVALSVAKASAAIKPCVLPSSSVRSAPTLLLSLLNSRAKRSASVRDARNSSSNCGHGTTKSEPDYDQEDLPSFRLILGTQHRARILLIRQPLAPSNAFVPLCGPILAPAAMLRVTT